jgi:hypothetical protein
MSGVTKVVIQESADELKKQMNKQFKTRVCRSFLRSIIARITQADEPTIL